MQSNPAFSPGRFPDFIKGVLSAIGYHNHVVPGWLRMLMSARIRRIGQRIANLLKLLAAGTYRQPRLRTDHPRTSAPKTSQRPRDDIPPSLRNSPNIPEGARLPHRFAWMSYLLRAKDRAHLIGGATELLRMMLENTELQAHCAACPALGRQLRPLCHMLGIKLPAYLKLPPRARKPRAPRRPGPPRPRAPLYPPNPLPPPPPPVPVRIEPEFPGATTPLGLNSWTKWRP